MYSQLKQKRPITHYNSKPRRAALQQQSATFDAEWDSPVTVQRKNDCSGIRGEQFMYCSIRAMTLNKILLPM